jgi:hypothetical protein
MTSKDDFPFVTSCGRADVIECSNDRNATHEGRDRFQWLAQRPESRKTGDFIPETHAVCGWDKLLGEMELNEEQALMGWNAETYSGRSFGFLFDVSANSVMFRKMC